MAVFEYQALTTAGKAVRGIIEADSPIAARRKLREQELFPTDIEASFGKEKGARERGGISRVSQKDISLLTRQLAVLLEAGMPLSEALGALLDQTSNLRLHKAIYDIRGKVTEGSTLADALGAHPRLFSKLYVNMVRVGEASGALEGVLFRLAEMQEHQLKVKHRIVAAMMYPIIMMSFGLAMIVFLMTIIVPKIILVFERQEVELPAITKALIATSHFMRAYWWLVLLGAACVLALWRAWIARPEGRKKWDKFKLRAPLFSKLYVRLLSARFARTMGTMLQSGLTMMPALDVVRTVLQNRVMEEAIDDIRAGVRRGRDLAKPIKEAGVFPPMLIHMVDLGERSGEMESMLLKIADTYDEEVQVTVDALVSLIEPMIIMVMGLFVGMLVFAILLPIFSMTQGI